MRVGVKGDCVITGGHNLMDNIRSTKIPVDGTRNWNFSAVSATVMEEDFTNNTTDFRMPVPSENAIIRCNMYVIPMGRDVIFYITVGNLQSGSGDFVTSVKVEQPAQELEPEQSDTSASAVQTPASSTSDSQMSSSTPETSSSDTGSASSDEDEDAVMGLEEFDASGNKVSDTSTAAEQDSSTGNPVIWWVIGGIVIVAIAGGCVWYFCFFRRGKNPFQKK